MNYSFLCKLSLCPLIALASGAPVGSSPWKQQIPAISFVRSDLTNPKALEYVAKAGDLSGKPLPEKMNVAGWFEYDFEVPEDSWYEVLADTVVTGHEFVVDGNTPLSGGSGPKAGNVWLRAGGHTLRVQRNNWRGFAPIGSFEVRRSGASLGETLRYEVGKEGTILRKGEELRLLLQAGGGGGGATLTVKLIRRAGKEAIAKKTVEVLASRAPQTFEIALPLTEEGVFDVLFFDGEDPVPSSALAPLQVFVVDTGPVTPSSHPLRRTLVEEIDCVTRPPDYCRGGETRIVRKSFGVFREGGDVGFLQNKDPEKPSWFAYSVKIPKVGKPYLVEIDYPDDVFRTMIAQVREGKSERGLEQDIKALVTGVGVDAGGEFALSNKLQTLSILYWPISLDWRIVLLSPQTGSRPAASAIRIYEIDDPLSPMPGAVDGRTFAEWYEEGLNYLGFAGGSRRSPEGLMLGTDRWLRSYAHAGFNRVVPTVAIYQNEMYPSRYNIDHCSPATTDMVRMMLLYCEKYGVSFVGEFHPEARELEWMENRDRDRRRNSLRDNKGQLANNSLAPLFSPIHPINQEWYLGMLGEFVERYKDSPALKGVSLRVMDWANPALNNFGPLEWGYDDYTISRFEADTGLRVPGKEDDPGRFKERYAWLTGERKDAWISWRCEKVGELLRKIVATVRAARPDLKVYMGSGILELRKADLQEYGAEESYRAAQLERGIDLKSLASIDGLEIVQHAGTYGRRASLLANQAERDKLVNSPSTLRSITDAGGKAAYDCTQAYFEARPIITRAQDMGYPENTPQGWMSGVVEPSGIHSFERWAFLLAENDARHLQDGGNANTVGQPRNWEFFRQYRQIPDIPFSPRQDARDPVAVWSAEKDDAFWFYAVNRESYEIPVSFSLAVEGKVVRPADGGTAAERSGLFDVVLKPYELVVWRAGKGSRIEGVKVSPPKDQIEKVRRQVEWFEAFSKRLEQGEFPARAGEKQRAFVRDTAVKAREAFDGGHLREARSYLENAVLIDLYEAARQYPPLLRDNGAPATPSTAWDASALMKNLRSGRASIEKSEKISPDWVGADLLASESEQLSFGLDTEFDGEFLVVLGVVSGGDFGGADITLDGKFAGSFAQGRGVPAGHLVTLDTPVALRAGQHVLSVKRRSGKDLGLQFAELFPVKQNLLASDWSILGPFADGESGEAAMGHPFAAMESGKGKDPWRPLRGQSPYVDLRALTNGGSETVHYLRTFLHSAEECEIRLFFAADFWAKAWLNGNVVQETISPKGSPAPYAFHRNLCLKKGANELVFKVASGTGGNGLWAAISNPGGITVSPQPEIFAPHE